MAKKTSSKLSVETKAYRVFDPENVRKTVEVAVKEKPKLEDLETVEKVGKKPRKIRKKVTKKKEEKEIKLKKNGYILVITEKPQAAGKIAAALSGGKDKKISNTSKVSYYELERDGKKIVVACAVGHLFSVSQNIKGAHYPIFDISWHPNFEVRKKDFTKKYYAVISRLVKGAGEIVVATDFDIEGEVIGYNIIKYIAKQEDAKRMKFSSLTAKEIENSYDNRQPTIEWGQAIAGETRHFLDWLYGINLSRALMQSIKSTGKFKIMSIGRVQGPALNLIVKKEKLIKSFKSSPYWQIFLEANDGKNKLIVKHNKDIVKKEDLKKFEKLKGKEGIANTNKKKQTITPPAPFDLTSLQREAYKFHYITPKDTLASAQKLYLAGLISYPRTSSQKIPEAMQPLDILKKLKRNFSDLIKNTTRKKPVEGNKSDPAHPSIMPTGNYQKLDGSDKKIYDLILKRFISCFCDNADLENKKVEVIVDKLKFVAKGMEVLKKGWMNVYPVKMDEREVQTMEGKVSIDKVKIEEKETKPPKRFSPASILSELEKKNLGTKATRANILDTLYNRNYIKDKQIKATELGMQLIDCLDKYSPVIIDEKLTREIEKDMDIIRDSKKDLNKKEKNILEKAEKVLIGISGDFKKNETKIGKELIGANQSYIDAENEGNKLGIKCPGCNKDELTIKFTPRFKSYFVACTGYPNCRQTFSLPRGLIKNEVKKKCEDCEWPLLLRIQKGKRPWQFCFNPNCDGKKPIDIDGNVVKNPKERFLS